MPGTISLRIPFSEKDVAKTYARRAGGRLVWQAGDQWEFVGSTLPEPLRRYQDAQTNAPPQTTQAAAPRAAKPRVHVLDVPFESRAYAGSFGAKWNGKHKVTVYEGADLPPELRHYASPPHSWERWKECEINGWKPRGQAGTNPSLAPRDHQHEPIELAQRAFHARRCGILIGDEVGLGKTYVTLFGIRALPGIKTVLVVCPLDVVPVWRNLITEIGDQGKRFVVITPGQLAKLFEVPTQHAKKVKTKKGVARYGRAMKFDCVVLDESHLYRNPTTQRSKFAAQLQEEAHFTLWLSATAGQTPLELSYLAPLMAEVTGARVKDLAEWELWCQSQGIQVKRGAFGKWEWESNADDLQRIRDLLYGGELPAGIRRTPQDLEGWPEIQHILTPAELGPTERDLYEAAWAEFREDLGLESRGRDKDHALVQMLRFRQKASLLRTRSTVEKTLSLLENGHQVAVSVEFHESLSAVRTGIEKAGHPCAVIHGKMDKNERERQRLAFQAGQYRVVLFTPTQSLSLHREHERQPARSQVIHDLRWSAIQMHQISGRTHRDGQFAPSYWMYGEGTIEARIAQVVAARAADMQAMQGDDSETMREIEQLLRAA